MTTSNVGPRKVGFIGPYEGLRDKQRTTVEGLFKVMTIAEFHHGDSIGAEAAMHEWVKANYPNMTVGIHPSDDAAHRAFADVDTNSWMETAPARPGWGPSRSRRRAWTRVRRYPLLAPEDRWAAMADETGLIIVCPPWAIETKHGEVWKAVRFLRRHARKTKAEVSFLFVWPDGDTTWEHQP